METLPLFRKLWGRIPDGLSAGTYTLTIKDSKKFLLTIAYNINGFETNKSFILTTISPLGYGTYIGYFFAAAGGIAFLMVLILWIILVTNQTKNFDYTALKW
jgi:hypothetical protein